MSTQALALYPSSHFQKVETVQGVSKEALTAADAVGLKLALQVLDYGEYLSYAKYSKYIPGAPEFLKGRILYLAGDACKVVKSGIKIKNKVDHLLSSDASIEAKFKEMVDVAQLSLEIANTRFVDYLPNAAQVKIKWMQDVCGVVRLGCLFKEQADKVSRLDQPSWIKTTEKLEAARLAVWTTSSAIDLVGSSELNTFKTSLSVGYGVLSVAKAGSSVANFFSGLIAAAPNA